LGEAKEERGRKASLTFRLYELERARIAEELKKLSAGEMDGLFDFITEERDLAQEEWGREKVRAQITKEMYPALGAMVDLAGYLRLDVWARLNTLRLWIIEEDEALP
jgi:hypothetical protein